MSWLEVRATFANPPEDYSPYVALFQEYGIDNTLESGDSLTGCLPNVPGADERALDLADLLLKTPGVSVEIGPLEEVDWETSWKQFFKPRRVGKKFMIVPTWESYERQPGDNLIRLDPGQAFGTGDHPTTRMCLELMETIEFVGRDVADIGCGSGILAIGAAQLGGIVEAFDIDPLAVEVAKANVELNAVKIEVSAKDGLRSAPMELTGVPQDETLLQEAVSIEPEPVLASRYHIVLSNIISMTLMRICPQVASVLHPGGYWIVSGIIEANWDDVRSCLEEHGFELVRRQSEDGWEAGLFRK